MTVIKDGWSFDLKVADAALAADDDDALQEVTVLQDTRAPGTFEIVAHAWNPDTRTYRFVDKVQLGAKVDLALKHRRTRHPIFLGELTAVEFSVTGEDSPPMVRLRGYDVRHRLMRGRSTRAFEKSKDSEAAEKIAGELGVKIQVTASPVTHEFLLQADQSDLDFLSQRAAAIGYELGVADLGGSLVFRPLKFDRPKSAELDLSGDVLEFHGTCSALSLFDQVTVRGWDPKQGKLIESVVSEGTLPLAGSSASGPARAKSAFKTSNSSRSDLAVATIDEAKALAQGTLLAQALDHVVADVVLTGDPMLVAGTVVEIKGAGTRFGARYYVDQVKHVLRRVGTDFKTHLKLRKLAS